VFLAADQTRVLALTEFGSGFWLLTPLRTSDGGIVLVNRGFVSGERVGGTRDPEPGMVTVTGLLRMTEPGGGFLRRNDPANGRWFSRDVQAIAAAHGIGPVAPYFIDAEDPQAPNASATTVASAPAAGSVPDATRELLRETTGAPIAGLTVITFHNNHLIYAITWYTLALMIPAALWLARRPTAAANPP
jgi:surfeit locus 1 family protein